MAIQGDNSTIHARQTIFFTQQISVIPRFFYRVPSLSLSLAGNGRNALLFFAVVLSSLPILPSCLLGEQLIGFMLANGLAQLQEQNPKNVALSLFRYAISG
jgi:hypothetical protein